MEDSDISRMVLDGRLEKHWAKAMGEVAGVQVYITSESQQKLIPQAGAAWGW